MTLTELLLVSGLFWLVIIIGVIAGSIFLIKYFFLEVGAERFCSRQLSGFKPGTKIQSDFCPRFFI